ncbi:MAG TPA: hypothetical protein VMS96_02800 [Terriglobales bacterium]|nr:hypothetical protein [Terriglobales bacterium]
MKRNLLVVAAVLLPLLGAAVDKKPLPLQEMKARAESAADSSKPLLYVEVVSREIEDANQLFTTGEVEKAHKMIKEAVQYAEKARDAAIARRHKMKDTEIHLRKAEHRLNDIRRTLALEDQPEVQEAVDRIAAVRKQILEAMFAPKPK